MCPWRSWPGNVVVCAAGTQSSACHEVGRNDKLIFDSLTVCDIDWLQKQYVGNCSSCGAYMTCRIFGSWLYFHISKSNIL